MTTPTGSRIYPPGTLQLTVRLNQGGQEAAVILGALSAPGTMADGSVGQAWLNHFWSTFQPTISNQIAVLGGTIRDTSQKDGVSFDLAAPASAVGAQNIGAAVAASAFLLRWRTASGGRSARGRTFLPGVSAGMVQADGRSLTPATVTAINGYCASYVAAFSSGTLAPLEPAVLSFTKGTSAGILSGACAPILGIQRRRMRG